MDNAELKREADALIARAALDSLLADYPRWFVGGSYRHDLMCWRDLDVYVFDPTRDLQRCFQVAYHVTQRLGAVKSRFTNNTGGEPDGFYWGILLGDARRGAWKLDLWFLAENAFEQHGDYADSMARRLTPEHRAAILSIKEAHWRTPEYRNTITSHQIYEAVMTHGVRTPAEFESYVAQRPR
jgi:hypothetical protein